MATIDTLIKLNISVQASPVPTASFSIPLIVGPTVPTTGIVNAYTDPAGLLTNGYTTSSPEYIYAKEMFEQAQSPSEIFVGKRTTAVAQVDTIAVGTLVTGHNYTFALNGNVLAYTSIGGDTQQAILGQLLTQALAISPAIVTGAVTGTGSGALLTLTSSTPGAGLSYTAVDADLTHLNVTPNHGIVDDLLAIIAANNLWYGIALCSNIDADILQLASEVETLKKIFIGVSHDSDIPTTVTTDLLSKLKGLGYNRTALMYSPGSYNLGIEAAWLGGQLPAVPGSNNWAYKSLTGIAVDAISDSDRSVIIGDPVAQIAGKNGNIYTNVGGYDLTQMGQMVSGRYIDITIGVDWLEATMQSAIMQALTTSAKIPYTDKGTDILINAVNAVIAQGVTNGLIDGASPITVTAPAVLSVPASQRANRVAPTITFRCRLQGAFNAVDIEGTVTV